MKRKIWIILIVLLLAAAICAACFWDVVSIRVAPRLILGNALTEALEQLDSRFENSPIHLLKNAFDPDGLQHAELQLETQLRHGGPVRYDMILATQLNPNRIDARGSVLIDGKLLDLSLYLDENFAAVTSNELMGGTFYGITYDRFSRDIRSREVLAALIGDATISQWEESVSGLRQRMSVDLKLPEFTAADIRNAAFGILALKPQVSTQEISLSGQIIKTQTVSFHASGQEIAAAAQPYRAELTEELCSWIDSLGSDPSSSVQASFFLHESELVQISAEMNHGDGYTQLTLYLSEAPVSAPLSIELETRSGGDVSRSRLEIRTVSDARQYQESLHLTQTRNGVQKKLSLDYSRDLSSGEMDVTILQNGQKAQLRLNLSGEGDTVTVHSQDIRPLLNLFLKKPWEAPAICALNVSPGSAVPVPEYRNLDQWSMEDVFKLLGGLGGLLGLKLP